jgi:hypothetical protein
MASCFQLSPWQLAVSLTSNAFRNKNTAVARKVQHSTGYRISVCDKCLSGEGLKGEFNLIEFEGLLKFSHVCDPKSLTADQTSQDFTKKKGQVQDLLASILTKVVDFRIGQRDAYLKIVEVPAQIFTDEERRTEIMLKLPPNRSLIDEEDCIEFNHLEVEHKDHWSYHWSYRAINNYKGNDKIKIARNELIEFLNFAKSTFGVFRFNTADSGRKVYFLLYLTF